jgi:hypothetical protein
MLNSSCYRFVLAAVLLAAPGLAPGALAQQGPTAPDRYEGIFGRERVAPTSTQGLDFTISIFEGYDDNLTAGATNRQPRQALLVDGFFTGLQSSLAYGKRWGTSAELTAGAGSFVRHYPDLHEITPMQHRGAIGFTAGLGTRARFSVRQELSYTPRYQFDPFSDVSGALAPAEAAAEGQFGIASNPMLVRRTVASFSQDLTQRTSFDVAYGLRDAELQATGRSFRHQYAGFRVGHRLSRYATLRLGYRYTEAAGTDGRAQITHAPEIGVSYDRPLSISRRTAVSFGGGTAIHGSGPTIDSTARRYRLTGFAQLTRDFGRSWVSRLAYSRGLLHLEAYPEPFYSDSVVASVQGYLTPRWDLVAQARYVRGTPHTFDPGPDRTAYTGDVRLRVAVSSRVALFAQGTYYVYQFGDSVILPAGLVDTLDRRSIRVGLTLWAPLVR